MNIIKPSPINLPLKYAIDNFLFAIHMTPNTGDRYNATALFPDSLVSKNRPFTGGLQRMTSAGPTPK